MLTEVSIQNFRAFDNFEMSNLSRINLIAGRNNAGKSSLLEAMFLASFGNRPDGAVNTHVTRYREVEKLSEVTNVLSGLPAYWRLFFRGLCDDQEIRISLTDDELGLYRLTATLTNPPTSLDPDDPARDTRQSTTALAGRMLLLHFEVPDGTVGRVWLGPSEQGVRAIGPDEDQRLQFPHAVGILPPTAGMGPEQAVTLGRMRIARESNHLLSTLKVIEPELRSVEDSSATGIPAIWGDVGLSELIPLSLMGEGMTHAARIIIDMWEVRGGVILIDEVESGLHHSVLEDFWRAIERAAVDLDVQVLATTHSLECIQAAASGVGSEHLRLHRLDQVDGKVTSVSYEPDVLEASFKMGLEVR
ncbi:MAG: AAA family ATPase [Chloroflexi bacterium]|nr:AAA family ATPase [Chloroflexota bacterium]